MKSMPMPPYSGGRWGAHSPADFTSSWISWRSALASARSSSVAFPPRARQSRDSLGRMRSLTIRAVRRRMSLMWSLSAALGVTLIGMARPPWSSCAPVRTLGRSGGPLGPGHPAPGEGPFVAPPADEADDPTGQRAEPVLEAGEEGDVDDEPQQPAEEAADLDGADFGDGGEARDHGQRPQVAVAEGLGRLALHAPDDRAGRVHARLYGDLGHPGQVVECHQVAHDEHLGMGGERAVGTDHDPAGPVGLRTGGLRDDGAQTRGARAGGPDFGGGGNPLGRAVSLGDLDALVTQ